MIKFSFKSEKLIQIPNWVEVFAKVIIGFFVFFMLFLLVTPWQQTAEGIGTVIAFDPNDRVQNINSPIFGRVKKWHITDGDVVKKGDLIVEIIDNDPNFIERLTLERDAAFKSLEAAKIASETAYLNYNRQKKLFDEGLSSRVKFEKAKIEYKKLLSKEAEAAAKLAKTEVKLSRQQNQQVLAPRDGTILRVLHGSGNVIVNEGDVIATFVPSEMSKAVEVYITGNDLPLVYPGRKVRLQFDGWPAVQFSGWPSVAIGTFGGVVKIVSPSAGENGKFRVIIQPDKEDRDWPDTTYLRQGAQAYAWILLNTVPIGYELWRKFNGFPPALDSEPKIGESRKSKKKKKDKDKDE
jgi:multidrug efflux pump subunit AcrA (membrane-fusion protein)